MLTFSSTSILKGFKMRVLITSTQQEFNYPLTRTAEWVRNDLAEAVVGLESMAHTYDEGQDTLTFAPQTGQKGL